VAKSIVIGGEIYQGANGLIEAGHMIVENGGRPCGCGQKGCVEAYSSALNTAARLVEAESPRRSSPLLGESEYAFIDGDGNELPHAKAVFEKAAQGNHLAQQVLEETSERLALLCINICRVVDPNVTYALCTTSKYIFIL